MTSIDEQKCAVGLLGMHRGACLPAEFWRNSLLAAVSLGVLFNRVVWARGRAILYSGRHDGLLEKGLRLAAMGLPEVLGAYPAAGHQLLMKLTEPIMTGVEAAEESINDLAESYRRFVVGTRFGTIGEFVRDYLAYFPVNVGQWRGELTAGLPDDVRGWVLLGEKLDALVAPHCNQVAALDCRPCPGQIGPYPTHEVREAVEYYWTPVGHSPPELDRLAVTVVDRWVVEVVGRSAAPGGLALRPSFQGFPTPAERLRYYIRLARWACSEAGIAFARMTAAGHCHLDPDAGVGNRPEPEPGADDLLTAKQVVALIEKEAPRFFQGQKHDSKRKWVSRLARRGVLGVKLAEHSFPDGGRCYLKKELLAAIGQLKAKGFTKLAN